MTFVALPYEVGPIRPPSEAASLLIRVTRNCPWNKCEFCPTYKGTRFERRPVEEVLQDIDKAAAFHGDVFRTAFIQDANSLVMKTDELVQVLSRLRERFPSVERVTSYARARTVARKSVEELEQLRDAGLSRLHIGLESGYDPLLEYMKKGVTSDLVIEGGKKVVRSGISLSLYVVLGLGGRLRLEGEETWRNHALHTARVLSEVNPDYIRVRTLTIKQGMPLFEKLVSGEFEESSDAEKVREERVLIDNLEVTSYFASDHSTNVLMDVRGQLPQDKEGDAVYHGPVSAANTGRAVELQAGDSVQVLRLRAQLWLLQRLLRAAEERGGHEAHRGSRAGRTGQGQTVSG
jgi:radical SAM superfamily enzyme YgiQ (UPF0313 family)